MQVPPPAGASRVSRASIRRGQPLPGRAGAEAGHGRHPKAVLGCDDSARAIIDQEQGRGTHPEMHQVRKGNPWYFGMKAHVGVDSRTRLIHSVVGTAANVADSRMLPALLHGGEREVCHPTDKDLSAGTPDGATRPTRVLRQPSAPARRKPKTGSIGAGAPSCAATLSSASRTTSRARRAPGSSTSSPSSSCASASRKCATAGWRKIPIHCSPAARW